MSKMGRYVKVQAVIPQDWVPKIKEVMEKRGYYSVSEFLRDLIRREIEGE